MLIKTGMYGKGADSQWGTVLAALGCSLPRTEFEGQGVIVQGLTSISFMPVAGSAESVGGPEELKFLVKEEPVAVDETKASQNIRK